MNFLPSVSCWTDQGVGARDVLNGTCSSGTLSSDTFGKDAMTANMRRTGTVGGTLLLVMLLTACSDASRSAGQTGSPTLPSAVPARVEISVPDGSTDVAPSTVVDVKAVGGELGEVSVTSAEGGRPIAGAVAVDRVWRSTSRLKPRTTYQVKAVARDAAGGETVSASSFTTLAPAKVVAYTVTPDGWTVGAGMPVQVRFDAPIPKESRAAIESQLTIETIPAQLGSWGWTSDTSLLFRPRTYWAAGTKVLVTAPLAGTQVGPGAYLMEDNGATLTIGTQRVLQVNLATHTMTATENGRLVRTFAISGGRPGERFETRGGTKVVMDKYEKIIMDSSTFGVGKMDPEYYRTPVDYAMRITDSGEFLHSAPWSVGQQGSANVSHGCINMAPNDALWLFERIQYGDVVESTGSDFPLQPDEAGIPVWLYSWPQWQGLSALAGTTPTTPAPVGQAQPSSASRASSIPK